jgi:hypothetical protein
MILNYDSWREINENDNLEAASVAKKVYRMLKSAGNEVDLTYQTEALGKKGVANHIRNSAPGTISVSYYVNWVHVVPVDEETADSIISEFESDTLTAKKSKYNDELYTVAFSIKDRKGRSDFNTSDYSFSPKENKNDRKRKQNEE